MDIEEIVSEILRDKKAKNFYQEKYPDFFEKMPVLSAKVFEHDLDKDILKYLMKQKNKMDLNKSSEHDASVKVGSLLVDKFVKNKLV
jgi:hypothetical protein